MMKHSEKYNAEWYNSRAWADPGSYNVDRYRELWSLIYEQAKGAESVLDLGCGNGTMLGEWPEPKPKIRFGVDFSERAIQYAAEKYPLNVWMCKTFQELMEGRSTNRFDVVILCEVLEHVEFDRQLFAWACDAAKQKVIVSVPNGDRCPGTSHTATRYEASTVSERFGASLGIVSEPDSQFLVFIRKV